MTIIMPLVIEVLGLFLVLATVFEIATLFMRKVGLTRRMGYASLLTRWIVKVLFG